MGHLVPLSLPGSSNRGPEDETRNRPTNSSSPCPLLILELETELGENTGA